MKRLTRWPGGWGTPGPLPSPEHVRNQLPDQVSADTLMEEFRRNPRFQPATKLYEKWFSLVPVLEPGRAGSGIVRGTHEGDQVPLLPAGYETLDGLDGAKDKAQAAYEALAQEYSRLDRGTYAEFSVASGM